MGEFGFTIVIRADTATARQAKLSAIPSQWETIFHIENKEKCEPFRTKLMKILYVNKKFKRVGRLVFKTNPYQFANMTKGHQR